MSIHESFRTQSSRGRLGGTGKIDEGFLEEYNHLRWLERDTTRNMASIADKTLSSSGNYTGQRNSRFYLTNLKIIHECMISNIIIVIIIYITGEKQVNGTPRTPGQKHKGKSAYVPRGERYNNLLDTAYADIVEKRKAAPISSEIISNNRKGQRKHDQINQPQANIATESNKTPAVSEAILYSNSNSYLDEKS